MTNSSVSETINLVGPLTSNGCKFNGDAIYLALPSDYGHLRVLDSFIRSALSAPNYAEAVNEARILYTVGLEHNLSPFPCDATFYEGLVASLVQLFQPGKPTSSLTECEARNCVWESVAAQECAEKPSHVILREPPSSKQVAGPVDSGSHKSLDFGDALVAVDPKAFVIPLLNSLTTLAPTPELRSTKVKEVVEFWVRQAKERILQWMDSDDLPWLDGWGYTAAIIDSYALNQCLAATPYESVRSGNEQQGSVVSEPGSDASALQKRTLRL